MWPSNLCTQRTHLKAPSLPQFSVIKQPSSCLYRKFKHANVISSRPIRTQVLWIHYICFWFLCTSPNLNDTWPSPNNALCQQFFFLFPVPLTPDPFYRLPPKEGNKFTREAAIFADEGLLDCVVLRQSRQISQSCHRGLGAQHSCGGLLDVFSCDFLCKEENIFKVNN